MDRCGNTRVSNFTLNVSDTEAPTLWSSFVFEVEHTAYTGDGNLEVTPHAKRHFGDDLAQFLVFDACLLGDGATMNVAWKTPRRSSTAPCFGISAIWCTTVCTR